MFFALQACMLFLFERPNLHFQRQTIRAEVCRALPLPGLSWRNYSGLIPASFKTLA